MSQTLDRIRSVVTRAKQNLQDFNLGLDAFRDSGPCEVRREENTDTGQRIYRLVRLDSVPFELTNIAADVIQNLRGSLDILAYQLVLAGNGAPPDWKVYYPISRTATDYKATRRGQIKCVRQEVIDAIDATEPYQGGKGHALWQLNELNKIPKHMDLLNSAIVEDGIDFRAFLLDADRGMPEEMRNGLKRWPPIFLRPAEAAPLNVGDILRTQPLDFEVYENRQFSFAVTFHAPGIIQREPALKTLQDMTNLVDDIVTTIGRLLP